MPRITDEALFRYRCSLWRGADYYPDSVGAALLWAEGEIDRLRNSEAWLLAELAECECDPQRRVPPEMPTTPRGDS